MKKKICAEETGMGYCPFFSPARDTAGCIGTQGLGGRAGHAPGHDTAGRARKGS